MKCKMCGDTNRVEGWRKEDGEYKPFTSECLAGGASRQAILKDITFLLAQFIRCPACGPFDPKSPQGNCEGCKYERQEIINHIWHYGELIGNSSYKQ